MWSDLHEAYLEIFGEHPEVSERPRSLAAVPEPIVPHPSERPDVEVLVDGDWLPGEVRMQTLLRDGDWAVQVQWQPAGSHSRRIDTFPDDRVRGA